jgi:hypothetical protein
VLLCSSRGTARDDASRGRCTDAEVASLTGHTLAGGSIRAYAARTRALAESAYTKLMEREEVAALPVAQQAGEAASAALNR